MSDCTIVGEEKGLYYLIGVKGGFNAKVLPQIRKAVDQAFSIGHIYIAIDLAGATSIDSTGVGTLANIHKAMSARGGKVCLIGTSASAHPGLYAAQIRTFIPFHSTLEEAEREIGA